MEIEENVVVTASFIQPTEFIKMGRDPIEIERVYREYEGRFISQSQLIDTLRARIEELETDSIIKDQDIKKLRNDFNDFKKDIQSFLVTLTQDNNKKNAFGTNEKDLRTSELNHQFNEVFNMDICGASSNEMSYEQKDCKKFCYDNDEFFISTPPTKCSENNYGDYVQREHGQKETNQKAHAKVERTFNKLPEKIKDQTLFKDFRGNFNFNERSNSFKPLSDDSKNLMNFSFNGGLTKELSGNVYSGITNFVGFQNTSINNKCGLRKRNFSETDFSIKNKKIRLSN